MLAVAGEPLSALLLESALASEGADGVASLPHHMLSEKLQARTLYSTR